MSIEFQPEKTSGFLLFDQHAQLVKDHLAFQESPPIKLLEEGICQTILESQRLGEEARLGRQELLRERVALERRLDKARRKVKKEKVIFSHQSSFRSRLYEAVSHIAPPLAERIIPIKTNRKETKAVRLEQKDLKNRIREFERESLRQQATLAAKQVVAEAQEHELNLQWLFESPERALTHALVMYAWDPEGRNRFLHEYAEHIDANPDEVRKAYEELAAKAAPSRHSITNESERVEVYPEVTEHDGKIPAQPSYYYSRNSANGKRNESRDASSEKTTPKWQVILEVGNKSFFLKDLSEEAFAKLIKRSKTPIPLYQVNETLRRLSAADPLTIYRYSRTAVRFGRYQGYFKLHVGPKMGRILVKYDEGTLYVRLMAYKKVYS